MTSLSIAKSIARRAKSLNGRAYLVGGVVRDKIAGHITTDIDLELFGFTAAQAHRFLTHFGRVSVVGRAFGVFLLRSRGHTIEVALPRRDVKTGAGHRGFKIIVDQNLSPAEATRRRDFTVNAMMLDPLTNKLSDPYRGQPDLRHHVLRAVDHALLGDDPLRLQRAFQLCARFKLWPDPRTLATLRKLVRRRAELPGDRKRAEWIKLITAEYPSVCLRLAAATGYLPPSLLSPMAITARAKNIDLFPKLARAQKLSREEAVPAFIATAFYAVPVAKRSLLTSWLRAEGFSAPIINRAHKIWSGSKILTGAEKLNPSLLRGIARESWPATLKSLAIVASAASGQASLLAKIRHYSGNYWVKKPSPLISGQQLLAKKWSPGREFGLVQAAAESAYDAGLSRSTINRLIRQSKNPTTAVQALHHHRR